jgi:hypothetical protein
MSHTPRPWDPFCERGSHLYGVLTKYEDGSAGVDCIVCGFQARIACNKKGEMPPDPSGMLASALDAVWLYELRMLEEMCRDV